MEIAGTIIIAIGFFIAIVAIRDTYKTVFPFLASSSSTTSLTTSSTTNTPQQSPPTTLV